MSHIRSKEGGFTKVAIPTAEGYELIPLQKSLFGEADDNYTHLHLKNKKKVVACRTLKDIEEQLEAFLNSSGFTTPTW
jgi:two-component system LytT family response regulator